VRAIPVLAHRDLCFASDACLKDDFSWHGVVEFKRTL